MSGQLEVPTAVDVRRLADVVEEIVMVTREVIDA